MLFGPAVRVLLWTLLVLIIVAVAVYLAIDVGLVDWVFGVGSQAWLNAKKDLVQSTLALKGEAIDRAVKIVGLAFTIVLGLLYFLNWWHHLAMNLPLRLQEHVDSIAETHLHERIFLFEPYATRNLRGDRTPAMPLGLFGTLLSFVRTDPGTKATGQLMENVTTIDGDMKVLSAKLAMRKKQRITAHLIEGLRLAAEASALEPGATKQAANENALSEFRKALLIDERDLDALEQAAKQAKLLNLIMPMQSYLEEMVQAAQDQKRAIRHARALRLQAEVLEERNVRVRDALRYARLKLEAALKALTAEGVREHGEEKSFELALVNEQLGSLHLRRGTTTLGRANLDDASEAFKKLSSSEGPAGLLRVEKLRARLANAQGGDEPDELGDRDDATFVAGPTHVTVEDVNVLEASKSSSRVLAKMPAFTVVTVMRKEQGWALVARRADDPIGYIPETKLRELHFE
jgi:hypothetical protein